MSAKGCEAAPKQATSVASDVPCVPVLLPVPGSSRTSEASPGPLPHKRSVARPAHIVCTRLIAQAWARLAWTWWFLSARPLGCRWFRP
ncbi:hypothetical protein CTI50_28060 [Pseudomonas syringae pv. actinidiae]|nr:hypothetical protein B1R35_21670 [Pseudomonas syringae pv. actinidiae]AYL80398.1 hypothetical protein CN228_10945 [Pseudomonas syringae pv. actinidiae str. Shaanxi_M228]AQX65063.1 hypothetical protein B1F85_14240 [Pseudomonas syringae pv. actinidiae]AYL16915.1 hypothetical protein D9N00_22185 [Pseudomonas syringae pv. actinidiae]NAS69739.1 hypothetical protein [Pseudomonas syringae pv. actinidiae]